MQIKIGSYTGNGLDNRNITGIGFDPDFVLVCRQGSGWNFVRVPGLTAGYAVPWGGDGAEFDDRIQDLITDGFQVGTNGDTNASGGAYNYLAMADNGNSDFAQGTYTGDGLENKEITVGFQPDVIIIKRRNSTDRAIWWTSTLGGDNSLQFIEGVAVANRIQSVTATTFKIGTDNQVNLNGATYMYVAFKESAGIIDIGSVAGNNTDDRNITGIGFDPELVWIKGNNTDNAHTYFAYDNWSLNQCKPFSAWGWPIDNTLQDIITDGFQLGNVNGVNESGSTAYYVAIKSGTSGSAINPDMWHPKTNQPYLDKIAMIGY